MAVIWSGDLDSNGNIVSKQGSAALAGDAVKVGDVLHERYELTEIVGRGGCGIVFRALDLNLQRDVAVKVLSGEGECTPEAFERFEREGQILRRLRAPNTVFFYDSGQTPQHMPFIVMEFVTGEQLKSVIERAGKLEPGRVVSILTQVFEALSEAHEYGFIHRDLKPGNIMLCSRPGYPGDFVKVLDFGIAKIKSDDERKDLRGEMVGTPKYMAPEQFKNEPVTAAADLYSMGCIAYEMLTGVAPFDGDTLHVTVAKHLFMVPPSLDGALDVFPNLEAIVFKLLEKQPSARFASAQDVINALEHWADAALIPELAGARTTGDDSVDGAFATPAQRCAPSAFPSAYVDAYHDAALKSMYALPAAPSCNDLKGTGALGHAVPGGASAEVLHGRAGDFRRFIVWGVLVGVILCFGVAGVVAYLSRGQGDGDVHGGEHFHEAKPREADGNMASYYVDSILDDMTGGGLSGVVYGLQDGGGMSGADGDLEDADIREELQPSEDIKPDGGSSVQNRGRRSRAHRKNSGKSKTASGNPDGIYEFKVAYRPKTAHVDFENASGRCRNGECRLKTQPGGQPARIVVSAPGYRMRSVVLKKRTSNVRIELVAQK